MSGAVWIPDHSAISAFRESPELFRLKYRLHLVPATPNDKMQAGSAIHAARNVLYEARRQKIVAHVPATVCSRDTCSYPACDCALSYAPADNGHYDTATIERAVAVGRAHRGETSGARSAEHVERIVRAYAARYATEPFEVVANEEYVEARISWCFAAQGFVSAFPHPLICSNCGGGSCAEFMYCGILDSAIRYPDVSEYVMDTKSTGAYLNEGWEVAMRLSDQMTGYVTLRRALGHRCDGYYVDGIHVSDYVPKPKRGETEPGVPKVDLEKDFVRIGPVRVPEWRVERWVRDMRYTLAQIVTLESERGLDTPWPIYQNWPYGKVDAYKEFYETPPELHAETAALFERRAWSPREVAEGRAVR